MSWLSGVGLLGCILLVAAWGWSAWRALRWDSQNIRRELQLARGAIGYGWRPVGWSRQKERYPPRPGWSVAEYGRGGPSLIWWIETSKLPSWNGIAVPLWIPALLIAIPTGVFWWRDRRYPPCHCKACGYNLTGNISGVCPECATEIEEP